MRSSSSRPHRPARRRFVSRRPDVSFGRRLQVHVRTYRHCAAAGPFRGVQTIAPRDACRGRQKRPLCARSVFLASSSAGPPVHWRLMAPDCSQQGKDFRSDYGRNGLEAEVGWLVHVFGGLSMVASLMDRRSSKGQVRARGPFVPSSQQTAGRTGGGRSGPGRGGRHDRAPFAASVRVWRR